MCTVCRVGDAEFYVHLSGFFKVELRLPKALRNRGKMPLCSRTW